MEKHYIDINQLTTPVNYAKIKGITRQAVYKWMKLGKIKTVKIDGISFIKKNEINPLRIEILSI